MDENINKDEPNIGTSPILKKVKDAIETLERKTNKVFLFCMDSRELRWHQLLQFMSTLKY